MSIKSNTKQGGFTLLEMLFGLGVGLFLLGNGILMYYTLTRSFYNVLATNRLEQQLRSAVNVMEQNIRRAGYSANAIGNLNVGSNSNPFMASAVDISTPSSSCILFSYDTDSNGTLPALNAANYDKRFAYRLSGTTLQSRPLTDSDFSCTANNWENMTDSNLIQITNLSFTLTPTVVTLNSISTPNTLTIRTVTLSLTGRLANDNTVTRTISQTIRVRNDKFQ